MSAAFMIVYNIFQAKSKMYKVKTRKTKSRKLIKKDITSDTSGISELKAEKPLEAATSCRICLKEGSVSIFASNDSENIAQEIRTFADIEISDEDEFPKHMCCACHSLLKAAVLFRKTAQETDQLLRESKDLTYGQTYEGNTTINEDEHLNHWDSEVEEDPKDNEFHCKRCQLQFDHAEQYFIHRKSEEHRRARVKCKICQASVASVYMNIHIIRHHKDEQPFICDVCGKSFAVQGSFKRHRLIHTDDLPFKCEKCPYRGRFRESLRMHMRVHTGEKPYACEACPARFVNKSNLNKHARTHQPDFNFKCQQCDRGFHTNGHLKEHLRVDHTGIREHICNICGKEFGYRKQMMKHQRKVHNRAKLQSGRLPLYLQLEKKLKKTHLELEPCEIPSGP